MGFYHEISSHPTKSHGFHRMKATMTMVFLVVYSSLIWFIMVNWLKSDVYEMKYWLVVYLPL